MRRQGTLGTGIDGSTLVEVDLGFGGGGGSLYGVDDILGPGRAMVAGQGMAHA